MIRAAFVILLLLQFSGLFSQSAKPYFSQKLEEAHPTSAFVVAHRGDWRSAPENSLLAIQQCINMGIDMVEIDVRKTKDGKYILMHDGSIDRTTNGSGNVWELSWEYLRTLNLKNKDGVITPYKIPTLEEALDLAKGKTMLNLDKAYGLIDELYPLIENKGMLNQIVFKEWMKPYEEVSAELSTPLEDIIFFPVISLNENGWQEILESYSAYQPAAVEVLFETESDLNAALPILKESNTRLWVNTMWDFMCGGKDDDNALNSTDNTYGWLYNKGFTVFQTDRPYLMNQYFASNNQNDQNQNDGFYLGADLSYVNEMNDCGALYYDGGVEKDVYDIFADYGSNLIRYRLWHNPDSVNGYSFFEDVKRGITRAKARDLSVLLDFHYSDIWADPGRQWRPRAWNDITDDEILADSVYAYTYQTLEELYSLDLLPEMVQIGNETNGTILQVINTDDLRESSPNNFPIDWTRQVLLLNHGIQAVLDFNQKFNQDIKSMLHIAQPENVEWWMDDAFDNGIGDFDIIGLSYYPKYSDYGLRKTGESIATFKEKYNRDVMIVEVAYPWQGTNDLLTTYDRNHSSSDQLAFMTELTYLVKENGGLGVIYWEPAWVDTECETLWGTGSSVDYEILFDDNNNVHQGMNFYSYDYTIMPDGLLLKNVEFQLNTSGIDHSNGFFVTGDFSGEDSWSFIPMVKSSQSNLYEVSVSIPGRTSGAYIFYNNNSWSDEFRETVPADCAEYWDTHRGYVIKDEDKSYNYSWGRCDFNDQAILNVELPINRTIYPNPADTLVDLNLELKTNNVMVFSSNGQLVQKLTMGKKEKLDVTNYDSGLYYIWINTDVKAQKLIVK